MLKSLRLCSPLCAVLSLSLAACSGTEPEPLGPADGAVDSGTTQDGGTTDTGNPPADTGNPPADTGNPGDTGTPPDTGAGDTGNPPADTGVVDMGQVMGIDLAISSQVTLPATLIPDSTLTLELIVDNLGNQGSPASELRFDIRLAGAPVTEARLLAFVPVSTIAAGANEILNLQVVVPGDIAPGDYSLRAQVDSNDVIMESNETNNTLEWMASLTGVEVAPATLDLGSVVLGCGGLSGDITLDNRIPLAASLMAATLQGSAEFTLTAPALPATINQNETLALNISYDPIDVGLDSGSLNLLIEQGGTRAVTVPLSGTGQMLMPLAETFTYTSTIPKADILFIVDNSCSMNQEQNVLSMHWAAFAASARASGLDWQIGMTTTDVQQNGERGAFVGTPAILTAAHPDPATEFANRARMGITGSGLERGLEASYLALTPPQSTTTNAGFLRPDASLIIIYLSDEEDGSQRTVLFYQNAFRQLKPSGLIRVHAITGIVQGGCQGPNGAAQFGQRYLEVGRPFSNFPLSICQNDWSPAVSDFGPVIGAQSYALTSNALAASIDVVIGGVSVPQMDAGGGSNWSFDGQRSVTVFTQALPPVNGTVTINYTPDCGPP